MREFLLLLVVALVAAAIVFGVALLATWGDSGLLPAEPDARHRTLPGDRPLLEEDFGPIRFDTAFRGYRMAQVDHLLGRVGYDLGYKSELIRALEAEVAALRAGRTEEADALRAQRADSLRPRQEPAGEQVATPAPDGLVDLAAPDSPGDAPGTAVELPHREPGSALPPDVDAGPAGAGTEPASAGTDQAPVRPR